MMMRPLTPGILGVHTAAGGQKGTTVRSTQAVRSSHPDICQGGIWGASALAKGTLHNNIFSQLLMKKAGCAMA